MDFIRMVACAPYGCFKERVRVIRALLQEGWKIKEHSGGFVLAEKVKEKGDDYEIG
ncbi:hypothetical protein LV469_03065 [Peptoniphilus sp. GNH]|nr:hypothetical protein LV469_03065 [Peptoniphilus sp. GNH]